MSLSKIQQYFCLLLGLVAPGFGYAIHSKVKPALLFLLLPLVFLLAVSWTRLITLQIGFYILFLSILTPWLYAAFAASRIRNPRTKIIVAQKSTIILTTAIFLFWWSSISTMFIFKERIMGVEIYRIKGSSMTPALQSGEYTILDTWIYQHENPDIRDIILFKLNYSRTSYIKRIVAIPGDTISFDRNSFTSLNKDNNTIKESLEFKQEKGKVTMVIPENNYFVIGDNIYNTQDSRHFGTVKKKEILGKFCYVLF